MTADRSEAAGKSEVHFTARAAVLVIAGEFVLLQRKCTDSFWAAPGGKIEPRETSLDAVVRELSEELGWRPANPRLACVSETLFEHGGRTYQQYGFYYVADGEALWARDGAPKDGRDLSCREADLVFSWRHKAQLATLDLRPPFLAALLDRSDSDLHHRTAGFS